MTPINGTATSSTPANIEQLESAIVQTLETLLTYYQTRIAATRATIAVLRGTTGAEMPAGGLEPPPPPPMPIKIEPPPTQPDGEPYRSQREEKRDRMAARLAVFDRTHPRPGFHGIVGYVKSGYLAKRGDGYVRTARPIELDA